MKAGMRKEIRKKKSAEKREAKVRDKQARMAHSKVSYVETKPLCPDCKKPMALAFVVEAVGRCAGKKPRLRRWCDSCQKSYGQKEAPVLTRVVRGKETAHIGI